MKWDNKLHQCDGSKNELLYRFSQGVYIYGAGVIGIQLSNVLKNMAYVEDSLIIIYTSKIHILMDCL